MQTSFPTSIGILAQPVSTDTGQTDTSFETASKPSGLADMLASLPSITSDSLPFDTSSSVQSLRASFDALKAEDKANADAEIAGIERDQEAEAEQEQHEASIVR